MNKGFIITLVLLSSLLFTSIAYCQQLTDWEWGVYYDLVERSYFNSKHSETRYSEVANKYGISVDKVKNIENEALNREPTEREWKIYDDLDDRLMGLPKGQRGYSNRAKKNIQRNCK